jgi:hypothetical protein
MTKLTALNFFIACFSAVIMIAFFMPWVSGRGSLIKPVNDTAMVISQIEPTAIVRRTIGFAKNVFDMFTQVVTGKQLHQTFSANTVIWAERKSIGPLVYLLYIIPGAAVISAVLSFASCRRKTFDMIVFILSSSIFSALVYGLIKILTYNGMFVEIKIRQGYWLTLISFLLISLFSLTKLFLPRIKENDL